MWECNRIMRKFTDFLSYTVPLIGIFLLPSPVEAQELAINPVPEPIAVRREQLIETKESHAELLGGAAKPTYNVNDFVAAPPLTLDEFIELAGKSELVLPVYTVDRFTPKAIAQAKKPASPNPADEIEDEEEVKVQADRTRSKESTETSPKYVVPRSEITATGATTVSEALAKIAPGFFSLDSLGGINTDQGVFLRGLGSNRFSVLIDGRPTTRPSNNRSADLGRLGVSNIERIELFSGVEGLRYGAGAIAGTINIITRLPDKEKLEITAEGGSYGFSRQTVNYINTNGLKPGTAGYIGYELNYERRSALNNYTGPAVEEPVGQGILFNSGPLSVPPSILAGVPFEEVSLSSNDITFYKGKISYTKVNNAAFVFSDNYAARIIYQPALDQTLRASVSIASNRTGDQFAETNFRGCTVIPANFGVSPELGNSPSNADLEFFTYNNCGIVGEARFGPGVANQAEDSITASLSWEWKLTEFNKLNLLGSFSAAFEDSPSSPGTRLASSQIIDVQLNYSSELAKNNTLNAGFEYFQQRYNTTPVVGLGGNQEVLVSRVNRSFFALDITKRSLAFYATDQWRFFDDALTLDLGVRLTNDQFFGTFTTPGAGLRWNFGGPKNQEPFAFRASWFQSFRAPGLADIFGYIGFNALQARNTTFGGPPIVLRNLALKPETAVSFDIGFDIRISPTSLFRITYFRSDLNNAIIGSVNVSPVGIRPNLGSDVYTPEEQAALSFTQCSQNGQNNPPPVRGGVGQAVINGQSTCLQPLTTNFNAQSYLSTGWEFSYKWQITQQLELGASYSLIDSRPIGNPLLNTITDTDSGVAVKLGSGGVGGGYFYGYQPIDIPFSTGNFGLRYASHGYRVALNALFVGLRPRAAGGNNYYVPYNRWDLTFGIPLSEEMTLTGGVFNIFNDRSVLGDGGAAIGAGLLLPPTTFRLGVDITFGSSN
jgi:iron complex outermembrane recepter protein